MNNSITEVKNTLEGNNSRINEAEDRISVFPAALAANSPEYLVLPEPLQPKQLHHLHTWTSQGQTQVLQGSLRSKPQWMTHMQRW